MRSSLFTIMLNIKSIHLDPSFEKILEKEEKLNEKATLEFATLKNISVEDAMDINHLLELARFTSDYIGELKRNKIPKEVIVKTFEIDGSPAEWTILPNNSKEKVFLYFFGGGYVAGSLKASSHVRYLLSKYTHLNVLGIEYSLAPEKPFPAALEDAIKCYKWLLSSGFASQDIVIGGTSAGGGLSVATLLKAKEIGLALPKVAVLISPWVDLTCRAKSIKEFKEFEPLLAAELKAMSSLYADRENKKNPYLSPVFGDLSGLPSLLIHAGSIEALIDDSQLLAEVAKKYGVDVTIKIWENMIHGFHEYGDEHPTGKKAYEDIGIYVKNKLNM